MIYIALALLYQYVPLYVILMIAITWGYIIALRDEKQRKIDEEIKHK